MTELMTRLLMTSVLLARDLIVLPSVALNVETSTHFVLLFNVEFVKNRLVFKVITLLKDMFVVLFVPLGCDPGPLLFQPCTLAKVVVRLEAKGIIKIVIVQCMPLMMASVVRVH